MDTVTGGIAIGFFPKFLRRYVSDDRLSTESSQFLESLAARYITNVTKNTRRGIGHLRPIIEERQRYLNEYGKDWTEKPVRLSYLRTPLCSTFFVE